MKNDKCEYDNDGKKIVQPGKFEGEPIFAPHYWGLGLEGFADSDDGKVYTFKFTAKELTPGDNGASPFAVELKSWLGKRRTLRMTENEQGFVHCS